MGKPFEGTLEKIEETIDFANKTEVKLVSDFFNRLEKKPLVIIGSGGSITVAHTLALLYEEVGGISKVTTPYELLMLQKVLNSSNISLVTAGGGNPDIISSYKLIEKCDPSNLLVLCTRKDSPLEKSISVSDNIKGVFTDLPCGKDGFLAVNSILASIIMLIRAFNESFNRHYDISKYKFVTYDMFIRESKIKELLGKETLIVLYGGWGMPAAVDIESKFSEAALGNILLTDYRNFAHGRHHWLSKRSESTGVIALVTPSDVQIAERTLNLIPDKIPKVKIETIFNDAVATIDLIVKVFYIVNEFGKFVGIDPGNPKVPLFGRNIYNLKYSIDKKCIYDSKTIKSKEQFAIIRKTKIQSLSDLSEQEIKFWRSKYQDYIDRLSNTTFGAIVLDYDGTICSLDDRFKGPSEDIIEELTRLLNADILVGIATGRGKSVRKDLRNSIHNENWCKVIIGYYNCSKISYLHEEVDLSDDAFDDYLNKFYQVMLKDSPISIISEIEVRPKQISIIPHDIKRKNNCLELLEELIEKFDYRDKLKVLCQAIQLIYSIIK